MPRAKDMAISRSGALTIGLVQAACPAKGAQRRMLYEVQVQASSSAVRASKHCYAPLHAAQLYADGGQPERTRTGLGARRQGRCRQGASANAFLQALAFVQPSVSDPAPLAVSALLRVDTGASSRACQAATSGAAALWGLLRTAALEHPDVRWTALGVDALAAHADTMQARHSTHQSTLICTQSDHNSLLVRTFYNVSKQRTWRLASRDSLPAGPDPSRLSQDHSNAAVTGCLGDTCSRGAQAEARLLACTLCYAAHPVQLLPQPRGSLAALAAVPAPHGCLRDDQARLRYFHDCGLTCQSAKMIHLTLSQVTLAVAAVALNFRDVLNVLGLYPGDAGAPGSDCAGRVTAVGRKCQHQFR